MMGGKGRTEEGRWKVGSGFEDDGLRREGFLVKEGFFEERPNKNLRRATKQASDIKKAGNFFPREIGLRPKEKCTFRAGKFFSPPSDHKAASLLVANFFLVALYFDGQ